VAESRNGNGAGDLLPGAPVVGEDEVERFGLEGARESARAAAAKWGQSLRKAWNC